LALTISGGHTQIVEVKDYFDLTIIGETTDDAVGEALTKAQNIRTPYPGGPWLTKHAQLENPKCFTKPSTRIEFQFLDLKQDFVFYTEENSRIQIL
jgi:N6-L-threonylcarbamoyladenine synthase